MGETHDELIELRFVMSDYLGHTHTARIPMVFLERIGPCAYPMARRR